MTAPWPLNHPGVGAAAPTAPLADAPAPAEELVPLAVAPSASAWVDPTPTLLAAQALDRFCSRAHGDEAGIARDLATDVAELGLKDPGAVLLFEEGLRERLAIGGLRQRAAVFRAAKAHFGWVFPAPFEAASDDGEADGPAPHMNLGWVYVGVVLLIVLGLVIRALA